MRTIFFLSLITFILTACMPNQVLAAAYKVTPRIIDVEVKPRDIFSRDITLTNNTNHNLNLYAAVNQVTVDEGGDITSFSPPSVSDNTITPTSWVSITRGRISLSAGQTKTVPLDFKIHPQAEAGVYHMVVGFGAGHNRAVSEAQIRDGSAPGTVLTISVDQERSEFLKLKRFLIDRFVIKPDNKAISYTLDNPGETNVTPTGEIIISNSRGEEVAAVPINPDKETLAPGQETTYVIDAPTEGLTGRYKAFLTVDYGTEQLASVYDTAFFNVVPWQKLLILFIVVLAFAILLTVYLHRKMGGRHEYEDEHEEVPLFIRESLSEDQDHDINLKK